MRFEWDEEKRRKNINRHRLDFVDVRVLFENPVYTIEDDRYDYGETRYFTLGLLFGRVVALSHTYDGEVVRVISLRKANKNEQAKYITEIANRLGEN